MSMNQNYIVLSDVHLHNWSAFSGTNDAGINTRLQVLLDALMEAANHAKKLGVERLYIAGDLFHVRGSIAPSVMNPAIDTFKAIIEMGIEVRIIPGNHDLESKDSKKLTNANQALAGIGVVVCNEPTYFDDDNVLMLPWYDKISDLMQAIDGWRAGYFAEGDEETPDNTTYIIHAPMNGVIRGIPDNGLDPSDLDGLGHRVLCGHYHNHRQFAGDIMSIGALTHQTWGDVGTKAGYLLVTPGGVEHFETSAPRFVDFDVDWSEEDITKHCKGNYVRVKLDEATEAEIKQIKQELTEDHGALGCIVNAVPKSKVVERSGATVEAGASLQVSIANWLDNAETGEISKSAVLDEANDILTEIGEV